MSTNYGFEPTLDGLNNIDADSTTTTNIICDTIQINNSGTAPTVSALSNDTNIATTAWVNNHASSLYVTLAGASQTISSEKTFSNANTFITGNTVTNDIVSASATTDINIGAALTTGDIKLGNSGGATNVALNWGGSSNSGNLSFQGGSFTLASTGVYTQRCGPTFDMTIADTQTSGILNIGTSATRTGAINIGTGATTTSTAILIGNQTGAFGSCDIGTTTITVGKSNTATNNIQTSTSGTLNLKTTSTGGNVNLGTGMTSGTITIGGGANIVNLNATGTATNNIGASGTTTNILGLTYINGSGTQNTGIGNTTGIVDIKGSNMLLNTSGAVTTNIGNALSTTYLNGVTSITGDFLIQQSTYPSTNTSQLGYNKTETLAEFTFTADTLGTIGSFTVPSKGVWICNISVKYRTTGGAGSFENVQLFLTDSASGTTAYRTFEYFDETDVVVGTNGKRFVHTISGTLNSTASQTFYIRGVNDTTGITTLAEAIYSYTRVG